MHIVSIWLNNWKCFRNTQLKLQPKAYSVVARRADDPELSNWAGKSSLLQAVHFALHGEHGAATEDGWITEGEKEGGVHLVLVNGDVRIAVKRDRRLGKSTQLLIGDEMGAEIRKGEEAQKYIDGLLGLKSEDFPHTCYFQQRQMARMVLARPQERMDVVGAWLQLGPLVQAEDVSREAVKIAAENLRTATQAQERATSRKIVELEGQTQMHQMTAAADAAALVVATKADLSNAVDAVKAAREVAVLGSKLAEYDRISSEGKALVESLKVLDLPALVHADEEASRLERELAIALGTARREEDTRRKVSLGQFDGVCPVAGIACPAKEDINKQSKKSAQHLNTASAVTATAQVVYARSKQDADGKRARRQEAERIKARVDAMRDQLKQFHGQVKEARERVGSSDVAAVEREMSRLSVLLQEQQTRADRLRGSVERVKAAVKESDEAGVKIEAAERELRMCREALLVFGRNGAQRRVAERAMLAIEDGANALLRECGIDLTVGVRWSREGEGLAKACDACGTPFPTSAKAKQCATCNADRGPLVVHRLDIELSDRSGAAEDLAGAAFQLSASAWLRSERNSAWSVALLDEPFSQLDAGNRRAFATHLAAMLSGRYGFSQSFVVSHNQETVAMLPGRIEITSDGGRSVARVVS